MSLIYLDGFDWITDGLIAFGGAGRWVGSGNSSFFDRVTDTASGTGAAARLTAGSAEMTHAFPVATTMVCGFRFRHSTAGNGVEIIEFQGGGNRQIRARTLSDGTVQISVGTTLIGTSTFSIPLDTWVYIEIKVFIDASVGTIELRFNGSDTPDIDFGPGDTHATGDVSVDAIELFGADHDYDDMYLDDSTFHGDVYVETLVADGAGADADFTPSAGSNFENVEELPTDDDATYNESNAVNDRDRFTHGDLPADTVDVLGVQVGIWCRKTVAGDREVRTLAYDGTNESEGAAQTPAVDYAWYYDMFEDHPTDANPWTESEVNSGEFGYTVES